MNRTRLVSSLVLFTVLALCGSRAAPLGSAFTYQGRLTEGGDPASGLFDFQFIVYDAPAGGSQRGSLVTKDDVLVTNGLFTVDIDIGPNHFTGDARWLEIGVRAGSSAGGYSALSPRQALTPAPYALHAPSAGTASTALAVPWAGLTGVPSDFLDGTDNDTLYSAGAGLTLSGTIFSVNFGGSGAANQAARSDHHHDAAYWKLAGNNGTTPGPHFLGTLDNQPLELRVNGARALRLEPNATSPNIIGGHADNLAGGGVLGGVIGGGGGAGAANRVTDDHGTVGGGLANQAGDNAGTTSDRAYATVGGGLQNKSSGQASFVGGGALNINSGTYAILGGGIQNNVQAAYATLAGGFLNTNNGEYASMGGGSLNRVSSINATLAGGSENSALSPGSSVGGGQQNLAGATAAVIAGGQQNTNTGQYASIPGGLRNEAAGSHSLAAGRRAKANHNGTFVWADSTDADFASLANNEFAVRAAGGVRLVTGGAGLMLDGLPVLSGDIGPNHLADGAVLNAKLADGAVTSAKIADGSVAASDVNASSFSTTFWKTDGNSGTTPGTHFVGTTDNQPLEFRVNNTRALRLFAGDVGPNHLGGHAENAIRDGAGGAIIAGGGEAGAGNVISDHWGFIGGGSTNRVGTLNGDPADATYATIAGGVLNSASAYGAVVGGGQENMASQTFAAVVGGRTNTASGVGAFVGAGTANVASGGRSVVSGGFTNVASGLASTVPGGRENTAAGNFSFAAGRRAKAEHPGAFVWADNTDADFASTAPNQFLIRADKVGIGTATPQTALDVAGIITWGTSSLVQDQGGSIELGDSLGLATRPYLDFHFGVGAAEDFNVRLINDASGRMTVDADTFRVTGNVGIGLSAPTAPLEVAGAVKATSFMGDGSALTLLNASSLASGTVAEARVDALLARDSEILPAVLANDGTGSGLDADLFDGLNSSAFWQLLGNGGTAPGTHFLGTTDNQALELKANNARVLRLEPGASPNLIGGHSGNSALPGVIGGTVSGGGFNANANAVTDEFGTIGGGVANQAGDNAGTTADRGYATVGGGRQNTSGGFSATVAGGYRNSSSGNSSTVSGGQQNSATDFYGSVGGGFENMNSALSGTVGGGVRNTIHTNATYATIGGGSENSIGTNALYSTIAGGIQNASTANSGTIGGGQGNSTRALVATIAGGANNVIHTNADYSTIGGGANNQIQTNANSSTIAGGTGNSIQTNAHRSTIGGGYVNTIQTNAFESVISGGNGNTVEPYASRSTIAGGAGNTIQTNANSATIGGGAFNTIGAFASRSTIAGGYQNMIVTNATYSTISGGTSNTIGTNAVASTIGGGATNTILAEGRYATISGGWNNTIQPDAVHSTISGGLRNTIQTNAHNSAIGGGRDHLIQVNADHSTISGGRQNSIQPNAVNSTIGGGLDNVVATNADYATIPGGRAAKANEYGQLAYASGRFANDGDAQTSVFVLRRTTTSAAELELFLDASSRRMIIPDDTSWSFDVMIVGRSSTGTSAAYKYTGLIVNNAGALFFLGPTKTVVHEDVAAWDIDVAKDNPNKALVVTATGAAATTIRWVATVRTVEVSF